MLVAEKKLDDFYPEETYKKEKRKRRTIKKKKKSKAIYKLLIMGMATIGLIMSLFILYRYAGITNMKLEIVELQRQKEELEKEKGILIAELETIKGSPKIEEDAVIRLGMGYPSEDQIVYAELNEIDLKDEPDGEESLYVLKRVKNIVNLVLSLF